MSRILFVGIMRAFVVRMVLAAISFDGSAPYSEGVSLHGVKGSQLFSYDNVLLCGYNQDERA